MVAASVLPAPRLHFHCELRHRVGPRLTQLNWYRHWLATVRSSASIFGTAKKHVHTVQNAETDSHHRAAQHLLSIPLPRTLLANMLQEQWRQFFICMFILSDSSSFPLLFYCFIMDLCYYSFSFNWIYFMSSYKTFSTAIFTHPDLNIFVFSTQSVRQCHCNCIVTQYNFKWKRNGFIKRRLMRVFCVCVCVFCFFLWIGRHLLRHHLLCLRRVTRLHCPSKATWPRTLTT